MSGIMKKRNIWGPACWPWELEILSLAFVLAALVLPYMIDIQMTPSMEGMSLAERSIYLNQLESGDFEDQSTFFWAVGILGLYAIHLMLAYSSLDMVSTSLPHLFSPLIFSSITYYRLLQLNKQGAETFITGKPGEIVLWLVIMIAVILMAAYLRKLRHLSRFKGMSWDLETRSLFDGTFFSDLAVTFRPLIYPSRRLRLGPQGMLIEGLLYVYPLSWASIQAVESVRRASYTADAHFYATSTKSLVRVQPTESATPVYISPVDREAFVNYCTQRLSRTGGSPRPAEAVSNAG